MAFTSSGLRSLLKSPNSPRRQILNVTFHDQDTNSLELDPLTESSHSFNLECGHSHSFRVPPDSISFLNGSSIEEVTGPDIDDILPKTDYTYSRTATYRRKYLKKIQSESPSPNMSRRRVDGDSPLFISDDESVDDYEEELDDEAVIEKQRSFYGFHSTTKNQFDDHTMEPVKRRHTAARSLGYASTPVNLHEPHHISAHDHYYKGMLLRSGSHIKGVKRPKGYAGSSSSSDLLIEESSMGLVPTYRADYDSKEARMKNSRRGSSTRTITTTTTTLHQYEDDAKGKQMQNVEDDSEMKLKYDESQSEKKKGRPTYVLQNLDGLDQEDEISDIENFETTVKSSRKAADSRRTVETRRHHSNGNFFSYLITTIITTIVTTTTTAAESVGNVMIPVGTMLAKPVTVPASWIGRIIVSSCSWILRQSASILLLEMESKHRRRRGCCFCFLPFLLLLPLALLAGYYGNHVRQHVGIFVSDSQAAVSSMYLGLWAERQTPVVTLPPPVVVSDTRRQEIDMTQINHYIQQTVVQMFSERQQEMPPGLTVDQVQDIVQAMLATSMDSRKTEMDLQINSLSGALKEDISGLRAKLLDLQSDIFKSTQASEKVAGDLEDARSSFSGMSSDQKAEWLANMQMLESKFLDLRNDVNGLANQNAALVAMVKSCCQNNTALAATVHRHMTSILSEIGNDDKDSALSGLMAWMQANYVDRAELDKKLSIVTADITDRLNAVLAERMKVELNNMQNVQNTDIKASIVSASIDEQAVKSIIEEALVQFSADRVGMPDFALESSGGSVLSVRCSETFYRKTALVSIFGVPLYYTSNSPRTVIQPNVHPGECWAFKGSSGFVVIQLSQPIQPTSFTLEHIPRSLAPSGTIDSAPQSFTVFGLTAEHDTEGLNLGNYTYLDNGKPIQHFPVQNRHPGLYQFIELRVLNNHGNPEFTCVYRFRVHGLP